MFVATQLATAATWDVARTDPATPEFELAAAIAATQALPSFVACAEKNIQLHGGIGFTWEHDAHVYLQRAVALAGVFGPIGDIEADVTRLTDRGVVGAHAVELPPEAETYRAEVARVHRAVPVVARRRAARRVPRLRVRAGALAEAVGPRRERGRAARDRRGARRRRRQATAVRDRRLGHPDDHAARRPAADRALDPTEPRARVRVVPAVQRAGRRLRRRRHPHPATKVDGGWLVNGQKVWTSGARTATAGSPPCAPIPTSRSTTASRCW